MSRERTPKDGTAEIVANRGRLDREDRAASSASEGLLESDVLPGTNVDYITGLSLWKGGAAFATTADGNVLVSASSAVAPNTLQNMMRKLERSDRPAITNNDASNKGSFNEFFPLPALEARYVLRVSEEVSGATPVTTDLHGSPVGLRRSKNIIKGLTDAIADFRFELTWEEAWMVLTAAARGVHPRIYGARFDGARAHYAMETGTPFDKFLHGPLASQNEYVDTVGNGLVDQLRRASQLGLLMSDIKTPNIVVTGDDFKVMFIDLGSDFARLDKSDKDCLFFINGVMLLTYMSCYDASYQGARGVTWKLRDLVYEYQRRYSSRNAPGKDTLCGLVYEMDSYYAQRISSNSSAFRETDTEKIAKHLLGMARHYSKWNKEKHQCNDPEFDNEARTFPQLIRLINERMEEQV